MHKAWIQEEVKNLDDFAIYLPLNKKVLNDVKAVTAATAKSLQSCPTLCVPIDGSLPGSPVPGILQARTCL